MSAPRSGLNLDLKTYIVRFASLMVSINRKQVSPQKSTFYKLILRLSRNLSGTVVLSGTCSISLLMSTKTPFKNAFPLMKSRSFAELEA